MARRPKIPTRLELLRREYADAVDAVKKMTAAGSYQAVTVGRRQVLQIHEELLALESAAADAEAALIDGDIEGELITALRELPHDMCARIVDAVSRPSLRVVSSEE